MHKPSWFSDETVMVSSAPTCGISKSGGFLPKYDSRTGKPVQELHDGELVDVVDDGLLDDIISLRQGRSTPTLQHVPRERVSLRFAVPAYHDHRAMDALSLAINGGFLDGFSTRTIGELCKDGLIQIMHGHGSAPKDVRQGDVPYIKVSDLRAGFININPTNSVPRAMAEQFWRGPDSGLKPFDLICPERASRNIGDFCVLMPGQERLLLTKEVIIIRPTEGAAFDPFYLLWALTLNVVRRQWDRVVFMQTNREDVGERYREVALPMPPDPETGRRKSEPFRQYFQTIARARQDFASYLDADRQHHFFISGQAE